MSKALWALSWGLAPGRRWESRAVGRVKQRWQGRKKVGRERQVLLRRRLSRDLKEKAVEGLGG